MHELRRLRDLCLDLPLADRLDDPRVAALERVEVEGEPEEDAGPAKGARKISIKPA